MKKKMTGITLVFLAGLLASGAGYYFTKNGVLFSAAVTCGTIFYHLAVRLAVGLLIDAKYHNQMDHTNKWFCERSFERNFYQKLQVKKWKNRFPTFTPENFDLKKHPIAEIVQVTCQAEIVHEVNMVLSFVPVLFSIWFGSLGVFLITSCLAFLYDGVFVIIQRYNRPRLIRLIRKQDPSTKKEQ